MYFTRGRPIVIGLALFAVAIGVFIRMQSGDDFIYSLWSDRDLWRSAKLIEDFQVLGSEMGSTAAQRTPGGLFYYVAHAMMRLGATPKTLWFVLAAANCLAGLLLYLTLRPHIGLPAALMSAGVYLASWAALRQMMELWNPAFAMIFLTVGYCMLLRIVIDRRSDILPWLIAVMAAGAQFHASALVLLPIAAVTFLLLRIPVRPGRILWSVAAFVIFYLPFLYDEAVRGFPWTAEVVRWRGSSSSFPLDSLDGQAIKFLNITLNFYRPPFANLFGGMDKSGFAAVAAFGAALAAINSVALITIIHAIVHLRSLMARRREIAGGLATGERIAVFNYLLVLIVVIGFVAAGSALDERRLVLLAPAGAVMAGLAIAATIERAAALGHPGLRAIGLAILVPVLGAALWIPAHDWSRFDGKDKFWPRYGTLVAMLQDFHQSLGYGPAEFRNRVVLASAHPAPRFVSTSGLEAAQFAVDYLAEVAMKNLPANGDRPQAECVAAINLKRDGGTDPERLVTEAARQLQQTIRVKRVGQGKEFSFVEYRSDDGNCAKTFVNAYVYTEGERIAAHYALPVRESESADSVVSVSRPDALAAFAVDRTNPFGPTLITLRRQENGLIAMIDSRGLRGYRGYGSNFQVNPRLVLADVGGQRRIAIPILEGRLGRSVTITPWHSRAIFVPPGAYKLSYETDRLVSLTRNVANWSVVLAESFVLE